MDIGLFENYEDDGQLSLFGAEEPVPEPETEGGTDVRIRSCSSCGRLLLVREDNGSFFVSECNSCGIIYRQKR